jgi:hypothetical protein
MLKHIFNSEVMFGSGLSLTLFDTYCVATTGINISTIAIAGMYGASAVFISIGTFLSWNPEDTPLKIEQKEIKTLKEKINIQSLINKINQVKEYSILYEQLSSIVNLIIKLLQADKKIELNSMDFVLLKRITESYLPEIIDNYLLLNEKDQENSNIDETVSNIKTRLIEMLDSVSSEASINLNKVSSLSFNILKIGSTKEDKLQLKETE